MFLGTFVNINKKKVSSVFSLPHSVTAFCSSIQRSKPTAMAELQSKPETSPAPAPALALALAEVPSNDAVANKASETEEPKPVVSAPEKIPVPENKQSTRGSIDRDIALAEVEKEKKLSYVKAWEESEKAKAENRAQKHLSAIAAWENSKKAALEAELKKIEEQLEKKKAEYGERKKNKMALLHKKAEEKRAMIEAKRGEEFVKTEEMAAKYRATGTTPKKTVGCF